MAITITCQCGKQLRAKDEYTGRKGNCPACKREFVIEPPCIGHTESIALDSPLTPEASPRADVDARSQARRPFWKDPIVVGAAAGLSLILATVFVILVWPRSQPLDLKTEDVEDYREILLADRLEKYKDYPDSTADEKENSAHLRQQTTDFIRQMPPGKDGWELLYKTSMYFDIDVFDLWNNCIFANHDLAKDGIVVEPLTILRGAYVAIEPNKLEPEQVWAFRHYIREYEASRKEYLSHESAVRKMINQRHFDPYRLPDRFRPTKNTATRSPRNSAPMPKEYLKRRADEDESQFKALATQVLALRGQPQTLTEEIGLIREAGEAGVGRTEFLRMTEDFLKSVQAEIEPHGSERESATDYRLTQELAKEFCKEMATFGAATGIESGVSAATLALAVKVAPRGPNGKVDKKAVLSIVAKVVRSAQEATNRSPLLLAEMVDGSEKMLAEDHGVTANDILDFVILMKAQSRIAP
jgi:hypothetical protein